MTRELLDTQRKLINIDDEPLGALIYETINEEDNLPIDIAKGIVHAIEMCGTDQEFQAANRTLRAITGYGIEHLIKRYENAPELEDTEC